MKKIIRVAAIFVSICVAPLVAHANSDVLKVERAAAGKTVTYLSQVGTTPTLLWEHGSTYSTEITAEQRALVSGSQGVDFLRMRISPKRVADRQKQIAKDSSLMLTNADVETFALIRQHEQGVDKYSIIPSQSGVVVEKEPIGSIGTGEKLENGAVKITWLRFHKGRYIAACGNWADFILAKAGSVTIFPGETVREVEVKIPAPPVQSPSEMEQRQRQETEVYLEVQATATATADSYVHNEFNPVITIEAPRAAAAQAAPAYLSMPEAPLMSGGILRTEVVTNLGGIYRQPEAVSGPVFNNTLINGVDINNANTQQQGQSQQNNNTFNPTNVNNNANENNNTNTNTNTNTFNPTNTQQGGDKGPRPGTLNPPPSTGPTTTPTPGTEIPNAPTRPSPPIPTGGGGGDTGAARPNPANSPGNPTGGAQAPTGR